MPFLRRVLRRADHLPGEQSVKVSLTTFLEVDMAVRIARADRQRANPAREWTDLRSQGLLVAARAFGRI